MKASKERVQLMQRRHRLDHGANMCQLKVKGWCRMAAWQRSRSNPARTCRRVEREEQQVKNRFEASRFLTISTGIGDLLRSPCRLEKEWSAASRQALVWLVPSSKIHFPKAALREHSLAKVRIAELEDCHGRCRMALEPSKRLHHSGLSSAHGGGDQHRCSSLSSQGEGRCTTLEFALICNRVAQQHCRP